MLEDKPKTKQNRTYRSLAKSKTELALESVEDLYGSEVWFNFVRFGAEFGLVHCLTNAEMETEYGVGAGAGAGGNAELRRQRENCGGNFNHNELRRQRERELQSKNAEL